MSTTHVGVYPSARLDVSQLEAARISVTVETDDRFPEGQIGIQTTVAVVGLQEWCKARLNLHITQKCRSYEPQCSFTNSKNAV